MMEENESGLRGHEAIAYLSNVVGVRDGFVALDGGRDATSAQSLHEIRLLREKEVIPISLKVSGTLLD
jgi:hypothetical protein